MQKSPEVLLKGYARAWRGKAFSFFFFFSYEEPFLTGTMGRTQGKVRTSYATEIACSLALPVSYTCTKNPQVISDPSAP